MKPKTKANKSSMARLSEREMKHLRKVKAMLMRKGLNTIPKDFGIYNRITDGAVIEIACKLLEQYLAGDLDVETDEEREEDEARQG